MIHSCRLIVEGRVQGVGFRYFTQRMARQIGVFGWVRNLEDGSVEIRAEGEAVRMGQFLARVRQGPSLGRVTRVQVEETPRGGFPDFRIEV